MRARVSSEAGALALVAASLVALGGCAKHDAAPNDAASGASSANLAPWSRTPSEISLAAGSASALPPLTQPDPDALAEIVAAAARAPAAEPSDSATKLGSDTKAAASASVAAIDKPPEPGHLRVAIGPLSMPATMSTPSIERAARAQLYWSLVTHCRDAKGAILPPDAVRIRFLLDGNGAIIHSTISVSPTSDKHFQTAADCMRRELETTTFRAEPGATGHATAVDATVPSTD